MTTKRETKHATEIAHAAVPGGDYEARMERLELKDGTGVVIRFSWWKDDKFLPQALEIDEDRRLQLFRHANEDGVLSARFLSELRTLLPR